METIQITADIAEQMENPFLKSHEKKSLGITGYQMVSDYGWYLEKETDAAILLTGFNENGDYHDRGTEEVKLWLPKSQIKVFEYEEDNFECGDYEHMEKVVKYKIFVKTWLFNQESSTIKLNHFESYA